MDTRGAGNNTTKYGIVTYNGRPAFCVNWTNIGYYNQHINKLNSFQLILVDRSDLGVNNFDIVMNYDKIQWETGDVSGGTNGLGGSSARVATRMAATLRSLVPPSTGRPQQHQLGRFRGAEWRGAAPRWHARAGVATSRQLGDGTILPDNPTPTTIPGVSQITAISPLGFAHSLALKADGTLTSPANSGRHPGSRAGVSGIIAIGRRHTSR